MPPSSSWLWEINSSNCASCSEAFRREFFFSSRRRHTSSLRDWSSDVCSSDLVDHGGRGERPAEAAVGALHAVVVLLLDLVVDLALAAKGQHVVLDPDLDVFRVHSGQLG